MLENPAIESVAKTSTRPGARPDFTALISAAMRAPSGDNLQPWRFVPNADENCVDIHCNSRRDTSPLNSGQRMSRIACGAAVENLMLLAREQGWQPRLDVAENI